KILEFYKTYDLFFEGCSDCWALRLCKKCFNDIRKDDRFDEPRKPPLCRRRLKRIESSLVSYCEILEENNEAFKVFEDIEMH
ncbi:MAG: hypothetical protein GY765_10025, partial [bacterium]|nr:hypothetical protein [bacterium]